MKTTLLASILTGLLWMGLAWGGSPDSEEAALIFNRKCSSCHTVGQGVLVGPDLKGVTQRRDRAWLVPFIQSSQTVISSGDPVAADLFRKFKRQVMPDHDLSADQIGRLLDLIEAGELQAGRKIRHASTATEAEVRTGRDLFLGKKRLTSGGASCSSCHRIARRGRLLGGTLAPDLTKAHSKFKDKVLARMLPKLCVPREPERMAEAQLTEEEAFALKAFLYKADSLAPSPYLEPLSAAIIRDYLGIPPLALAASAVLVALAGRMRRKMRKAG